MRTPDFLSLVVLATAAWRTWHLIAHDDILDRPRRALLRLGNWREEGDPVPADYRSGIGEFLRCAYCLGFWTAVAWFAAWEVSGKWTLIVAMPFALSAGVVALAKHYSD